MSEQLQHRPIVIDCVIVSRSNVTIARTTRKRADNVLRRLIPHLVISSNYPKVVTVQYVNWILGVYWWYPVPEYVITTNWDPDRKYCVISIINRYYRFPKILDTSPVLARKIQGWQSLSSAKPSYPSCISSITSTTLESTQYLSSVFWQNTGWLSSSVSLRNIRAICQYYDYLSSQTWIFIVRNILLTR